MSDTLIPELADRAPRVGDRITVTYTFDMVVKRVSDDGRLWGGGDREGVCVNPAHVDLTALVNHGPEEPGDGSIVLDVRSGLAYQRNHDRWLSLLGSHRNWWWLSQLELQVLHRTDAGGES